MKPAPQPRPIAMNERSEFIQPNLGGVISKISWQARQEMFKSLMRLAAPTPETRILDVGVTNDRREDSNFFERLYPYPNQVTAVGLEDASFLEVYYPGVRFVQADALRLPFRDQSFDLVVSFAVIEHLGSRARQRAFIHELCRVGRTCCLTRPNRWYPIEFHSILPVVHWLPPAWFRYILRMLGKDFFAREENLNILGVKELKALLPNGVRVEEAHHRLLGPISNLMLYIQCGTIY